MKEAGRWLTRHRSALAGDIQHRFAEIETHDVGSASCEREGDIPGATTKIECLFAGLRGSESDEPAFPQSMQAKALQVVDQVVTWRDGSKQISHPSRSLLAGCIVFVCHLSR